MVSFFVDAMLSREGRPGDGVFRFVVSMECCLAQWSGFDFKYTMGSSGLKEIFELMSVQLSQYLRNVGLSLVRIASKRRSLVRSLLGRV